MKKERAAEEGIAEDVEGGEVETAENSRGAAAEEEAGDEVHEGGVRGFSIGIGMGMFWNVPEERKREVECSSV